MHLLTPLLCLLGTAAALVTPRQTSLQSCLTLAAVPAYAPGTSSYTLATTPFNTRFTPYPSLVAAPRTTTEVVRTITCAKQSGLKISIKSGGHSYAAHALAAPLVLDLINFQRTTLDAGTNLARVGGGVRLGNMATRLFNLAQRGVPHGTCAGVGIGGHATLGGFGLSSRLWGLTTDVVESMEVVTADGVVRSISAAAQPELFWAMRGAGAGNFGVVTEFRLRTFAAPSVNINWRYTYNFAGNPGGRARALQAVLNWGVRSAPKELGYGVLMFQGGVFNVRGVYYGPRTTFNTIIAPLLQQLDAISPRVETWVQQMTYIQSLTNLAGEPLTIPYDSYNQHQTFYAKSLVTPNIATPISLTALQQLSNYLEYTPVPSRVEWMVIFNLYGGPGSRISAVGNAENSYPHHGAGYVAQFYAWNNGAWVPQTVPFVKGMVDAMGSEVSGWGAYGPYVDPELGSAAKTAYWGGNVARLEQVKQTWDAGDLWLNPQGF